MLAHRSRLHNSHKAVGRLGADFRVDSRRGVGAREFTRRLERRRMVLIRIGTVHHLPELSTSMALPVQ